MNARENSLGKNPSWIQDVKSSTDLHRDNDKWERSSLRFNINLGRGWCLLLPISKVLITQYGARTGVEPLRFIIFIALLTGVSVIFNLLIAYEREASSSISKLRKFAFPELFLARSHLINRSDWRQQTAQLGYLLHRREDILRPTGLPTSKNKREFLGSW